MEELADLESGVDPGADDDQGLAERTRAVAVAEADKAKQASERHVSVAVPFRAYERNRNVAAGVLAGGMAYRLFLWLLPFGLVVGGALGLGDAASTEDSIANGGLPQAVVNAVGDVARAADANAWWLLVIGVPLLLYEGYAGAKAVQLIHSLVWNDSAPRTRALRSSLVFTAGVCVFMGAIVGTWWLRDSSQLGRMAALLLMIVPLAALWLGLSLRLPHGTASWMALLPGAFFVAVCFQFVHGSIVFLLGPKLEKSTSLYGGLGVVATLLFFMYVVGRIVVTAPILNSALHEELTRRNPDAQMGPAPVPSSARADSELLDRG
jgi:uncharacterized BrkB/YihY/UPF0761 family membrane protein